MAAHKGLPARCKRANPNNGCGHSKVGAVGAWEEPLETCPTAEHHAPGNASPARQHGPDRGLREELLQHTPAWEPSPPRQERRGISPPAAFCNARFFNGISPCKSIRGFNHITPRGEQRGSCRVCAGGEPHLAGFVADGSGGAQDHIWTPAHCCSLPRSFLEHPWLQGSARDGSGWGWRPHRGKGLLPLAGQAVRAQDACKASLRANAAPVPIGNCLFYLPHAHKTTLQFGFHRHLPLAYFTW